MITKESELTHADWRIVSFPLTMLETLSSDGSVFLIAESNYVSIIAVICYLRQILAYFNVTLEGHYGQRTAMTKRTA